MIEKMKFVSISGPKNDLDRMVNQYLSHYEIQLENALTDNEKAMTGMGTKVLIWPDKKAFDTVSGELTDLAAAWTLSGGTMTVTPCDGEGRTYTPDGVGTTEPESPADGQLFLKGDAESPYGAGSLR